jgi:carbamoyltransferase
MPFGPVVRSADADRWFRGLDKVRDAVRFMTTCVQVTPEFQASCPAVVHVDGTCRPQVLAEAEDPALHRLLGEMETRGFPPVLINTSFNLHEEPIVSTPRDAVQTWRASGLPALWLGPFVVERDA